MKYTLIFRTDEEDIKTVYDALSKGLHYLPKVVVTTIIDEEED